MPSSVVHQLMSGSVGSMMSHPITYAKVLIQIGYEPIAPKPGKNFYGRDVYMLPGLKQYVGHIVSVDGSHGLLRGFVPRLMSNVVSSLIQEAVTMHLPIEEETELLSGESQSNIDVSVSAEVFLKQITRESLARTAGVIVSHPIQVISIRCMAQFIGHESMYSGFFSSITEVYHENGIMGYFAGLAPRLIGELCTLWLARFITHCINNYLLDSDNMRGKKELKLYTKIMSGFFASVVTYPFTLVSTIMAVNNSSLLAEKCFPPYTGWVDCWKDLRSKGELKRGSSIFLRRVCSKSTLAKFNIR